MRAVVVRGVDEVAVETVDDARIEAPTDILLRVTSSAICDTDLHIYEGRMGDVAGMVIGHEPLGVVEEVGSAVVSVKKGDRGTDTEFVRVPFADMNCLRLPGEPRDD